ncbi:hypothetical protein BSY16_4064 (plasmid) [Sinorhizobium sp. RAC02]|nr:hypothetical protein BSY16_4064 [Sinorhizobium sp. RAC02]
MTTIWAGRTDPAVARGASIKAAKEADVFIQP